MKTKLHSKTNLNINLLNSFLTKVKVTAVLHTFKL